MLHDRGISGLDERFAESRIRCVARNLRWTVVVTGVDAAKAELSNSNSSPTITRGRLVSMPLKT